MTATVAPHSETNIPISVQFVIVVILYFISRKLGVHEQQVRGHLLWLNVVKQAGWTFVLWLSSSRSGLLYHARVRVVFVAVVPILVLGLALLLWHSCVVVVC
jgi:hypothetical protein